MAQRSQYILGKRIARGGMAEIFLAKAVGSDDFQKIWAVKKILPHYAQEKEYVEMFRAEASICKRLQHANIVQVYDFKKVDDSYAIIMEFVDGADLRSLLAACEKSKTRMNVPMSIYVAMQAARGLHYAHTKTDEMSGKRLDIVHRDISPQNLLISYEGEVKVIDFGIAKFDSTQETKPGVVKGKYSYMSPEQVSAKPLDARTDVFSLAIVLWEMLGMKRLFAAESEVETIKNVQNCVIKRSLMELNPGVDQELNDIILRGLAKDRKRRYETASLFEKDLNRYLNRRYPEFSATDLGSFLRNMFVQKRLETQKFVQDLLAIPTEKTGDMAGLLRKAEEAPTLDPRSVPIQSLAQETKSPPVEEKVSIVINPNEVNIPLAVGASSVSASSYRSTASKAGDSINSVSLDIFGKPQSQNQKTLPPKSESRSQPAGRSATAWNVKGSERSKMSEAQQAPWAEANNRNLAYYLIGFGAALLLVCGVALVRSSSSTPTRQSMQVLLSTKPENVTITVDGKPVDNGSYIETPRRFSLPTGHHTMVISRENYLPRKVEIDGHNGDIVKVDNLNLILDPNAQITPININTKSQKLYIVLNNGAYKGFAPVRLTDQSVGKRHTLVVYPNFPQKRGGFKCSFIAAPRKNGINVTIITNPDGSNAKCVGG